MSSSLSTRFKGNFFARGCDLMKCMKIMKIIRTIEPNQIVQRFQDTFQSSRLHIINITTEKELVVAFTLGIGKSTAYYFPRNYLKKINFNKPFFFCNFTCSVYFVICCLFLDRLSLQKP